MTTLYATGHNRHAIRKSKHGPEGNYDVVFHGALEMVYLFNGTKNECKSWLKEQIRLIKAGK